MLNKNIVTVDYLDNDMVGGVQTEFKKIKALYPNTKHISYKTATSNRENKPIDNHARMSGEMDTFLCGYERLIKPDVIIKNSNVATYHKPIVPQITILQDNNIKSSRLLFDLGLYSKEQYSEYQHMFTMMQKTTMDNSDVVVAVSREIAESYKDKTDTPIVVIPNGVDTEFWTGLDKSVSDSIRTELNIPLTAQVGISVQKLHPIKGFHIMTEIARRMPDIYWIIVLVAPIAIKTRLPNVRLVYECPPDVLLKLYNASNFYVQTSINESYGLCAVEAMSCGLPIVSSNTGILHRTNMTTPKTNMTEFGCLIDGYDPDDFITAIESLDTGYFIFKPRDYVLDNALTLDEWKTRWTFLIDNITNSKP